MPYKIISQSITIEEPTLVIFVFHVHCYWKGTSDRRCRHLAEAHGLICYQRWLERDSFLIILTSTMTKNTKLYPCVRWQEQARGGLFFCTCWKCVESFTGSPPRRMLWSRFTLRRNMPIADTKQLTKGTCRSAIYPIAIRTKYNAKMHFRVTRKLHLVA